MVCVECEKRRFVQRCYRRPLWLTIPAVSVMKSSDECAASSNVVHELIDVGSNGSAGQRDAHQMQVDRDETERVGHSRDETRNTLPRLGGKSPVQSRPRARQTQLNVRGANSPTTKYVGAAVLARQHQLANDKTSLSGTGRAEDITAPCCPWRNQQASAL